MTEAEWRASDDPRAMLDWLRGGNPPPSDRKLRLFACGCSRLAWPLLTDRRSRAAVVVAERFADGLATGGELQEAHLDAHLDLRATERARLHEHEALARLASWENSIYEVAWRITRCRLPPPAAKANLLRCLFNPSRPVTIAPAWIAPDVLTLAQSAYDLRAEGRPCGRCEETGVVGRRLNRLVRDVDSPCPDCGGAGRVEEGLLDPHRLAVLSDALEEEGCPADVGCPHGCYALYGCRWRNGQQKCDCLTGRVPHPLLAHLRGPGPHARGCWAVDLLLGKT